MIKLLTSILRRIITAVSSPFRMLIVRIQKLFNVNIISAKLIKPLTGNVKKIITLRPSSREDYVSIGRFWVYRKLFYFLILAVCAAVFIYFAAFATKPEATPVSMTDVQTTITYDYDDIQVREFSGIANIRAENGVIVYTGELSSGVCKGLGALYNKERTLLYEGEFANNKYNGEGTRYEPSGKVLYQGGFSDNLYHGQGKLHKDGKLVYDGTFKNGKFDGEGRYYGENGLLQYSGQFSEDRYHGEGTRYHSDGTKWYKGEFFEGEFQGEGSLYSSNGRLLYTGPMYGGEIDYRAFVGATLQDVEAAFSETPRIYYQEDGNSCFVYEQAGIILTTDCRIKVWKEEKEKENISDGYYYMPGDIPGTYGSTQPEIGRDYPQAGESLPYEGIPPEPASAVIGNSAGIAPLAAAGGALQATPMSWAVFDPYVPQTDESSKDEQDKEDSSSSKEESSSRAESSQQEEPVTEWATPFAGSASGAQQEGNSSASGTMGGGDPDFVETQLTLYFEIDKDVWRSETSLNENQEKNKIFIKRITILGQEVPPDSIRGMEIEDNAPPSIEDCVAIDYVRQAQPTAFNDISFEMDKQNKLFIRLWNINYADKITRRVFTLDNQTWRYCYWAESGDAPAYYSIEM
ncbi:hypothetical protein LJC63_00760 [Ruminococcaceae bacterium OttesenSCG-928-L11]|nr:hypothetical protein [Ruminococcaceae bacterium OttesenSCG-928-L11]